jgi:protein-S-isoprenylcysteine O-methyltransferase Ste14
MTRPHSGGAGFPLEGTKFYDVLAASPLVAAYGWFLLTETPGFINQLASPAEDAAGPEVMIGAVGGILSLAVAGLLIILVFVRTVPIRKASGVIPRVVALAGAAGGVALLSLPEAPMPLWLETASIVLMFTGMGGMLVSLLCLRRAFSVFPEARALVTTGPYTVVRHPVYLFEEVTFFGMMLQFTQPWAFVIFVAQCAFQLMRIPYEEHVLRETFPEYEAYAARTARILPGFK